MSDYLVLRFRAHAGHFIALFNKNALRDLRSSTLNIKQEQRHKSNFSSDADSEVIKKRSSLYVLVCGLLFTVPVYHC